MVNGYCYDCALLRPSISFTGDVPHCPDCESEVVELLETWEAIGNLNLFVSGSTQSNADQTGRNSTLSVVPAAADSDNVHIASTNDTNLRVSTGSSSANTRTISFVTDGRNVMSMSNFLTLLRQAGETQASPASQGIVEALRHAARPAREYFEFFRSVDTEASGNQCTICLAAMVNEEMITQMGCSHTFHLNCLMSWLEQQHTCPVCRAECSPRS